MGVCYQTAEGSKTISCVLLFVLIKLSCLFQNTIQLFKNTSVLKLSVYSNNLIAKRKKQNGFWCVHIRNVIQGFSISSQNYMESMSGDDSWQRSKVQSPATISLHIYVSNTLTAGLKDLKFLYLNQIMMWEHVITATNKSLSFKLKVDFIFPIRRSTSGKE